MKTKVYCGIGSRKTPIHILRFMTDIARFLSHKEYVLRSGGAPGADTAFEQGVSTPALKEIFLPWMGFNKNSSPYYILGQDALKLAKEYHPSWYKLTEAGKKLIARDGYQVLGHDLNSPAEFIICYTPHGKVEGGTGQAIRIAQHYNILVINLYYNESVKILESWIKTGEIFLKKGQEVESWNLM